MPSYKNNTNLHKEIQEAFSRKGQVELLLSKLEEINGSIEEEQKSKLKAEYEVSLSKANGDILEIKERISEQIATLQEKEEVLKEDSKNLDARFKVGEIGAEVYRKQGRDIAQEIAKLSEQISRYGALLRAQSAIEVGSDINSTHTAEGKTLRLNDLPAKFEFIKELQLSDFTTFFHYSEFKFTKMNKIVVLGTCFMVLSLFMPWETVFGVSKGAALQYVFLSLVAIAAVFMKNPKASALVLTCVGGINLLVGIYSLLVVQHYSALMQMFDISFNIGFYLNLIGSLALAYVGILRLKENTQ